MKKTIIYTLFFLLFSSLFFGQTFVQQYANIANQVTQSTITTNLTEFQNLGVKRRGTQPLENTYNWLRNKYLGFGYTASQLQVDTFSNSSFTCKNLIITKVGTLYPNTYVIICGHYDSIIGTGTNDNGSGTSTILEVARLLQNVSTEYSIKFIHFSGEEDGLIGSQHYVSSVVNGTTPKMNIKLVFNLDQVGGVAGAVNNTITCERDLSSPTTNNAASNTITNELITCVGLYSPLNTNLSYAYSSDYIPFENNNEVITGFYETNESTHPHSSTDLLINMDPVYNYNVAKAATGAMLHFAVAPTTLGLNSIQGDFKINFYPNPTKEYLFINFCVTPEDNYTLQLIDINGKVVQTENINNPKQVEIINVSKLSKGIYLANLVSEKGSTRTKIVID
ncbi:MAG: aminopeptidase YwaD [Flavobacterium sp.]|jgi:aminopeptidase YwaD